MYKTNKDMISYTCPFCYKLTTDNHPVHIKSLEAIKHECKCVHCERRVVVVVEAFYELHSNSLKKLHLEKFYPS